MLENWRKKIHSPFANNIWGAVFVDMQFISKFSIYAWVIHSIDKKGITIVNDFKKILNESNCKSKKIWVDKSGEFDNRSMKLWLEENAIEMYSTHNERKSVVTKRFIRILKNKIYKYMTSLSKNLDINKLDDIVNKYNKKYHSAIEMEPVDIKSNTSINSGKDIYDTDP